MVNKAQGIPGRGFFELMRELDRLTGNANSDGAREFAEVETRRCFQFWKEEIASDEDEEPVSAKPSPPTAVEEFEVGDYVHHERFGLGRVAGLYDPKVGVDFPKRGRNFILPSHLSLDEAESFRDKLLADAGYERREVEWALSEVKTLRILHDSRLEFIVQLQSKIGELSSDNEKSQEENSLLLNEIQRLKDELLSIRRALAQKGLKAWIARKVIN